MSEFRCRLEVKAILAALLRSPRTGHITGTEYIMNGGNCLGFLLRERALYTVEWVLLNRDSCGAPEERRQEKCHPWCRHPLICAAWSLGCPHLRDIPAGRRVGADLLSVFWDTRSVGLLFVPPG